MTTPGTASSTDARKRKAERETAPPILPDTWIDGDVIRHCDIDEGTWVRTGRKWHNCERSDTGRVFDDDWATRVIVNGYGKVLHANRESAVASLPPAPVWSVISTDEDQPTLARVTFDSDFTTTRLVFRDDHFVYDADSVDNIGRLDYIYRVELLHTHNPATQVPVDRSLVEVAQRRCRSWDRDLGYPGSSVDDADLIRSLAALADEKGAES